MNEGKRLWDLLDDRTKLKALLGELPEGFLEPDKLKLLYDYIGEIGLTADSYFPERVEAIRNELEQAGVEYDEAKTADENLTELFNSTRPEGDEFRQHPDNRFDVPRRNDFREHPQDRFNLRRDEFKEHPENRFGVPTLLRGLDPQAQMQESVQEDEPEGLTELVGLDPQALWTPDGVRANWSDEQRELYTALGFGGVFLQHRFEKGDLVIGLVNGVPVPHDTPGAQQMFLVDYVEQAGIDTSEEEGILKVQELFAMTAYYDEASQHTQNFEKTWYGAGTAQQDDMLKEPIELIEDLLQYFGQDYSPEFARDLAFEAARLNLLDDDEFMVNAVVAHADFDLMQSQTSASAQMAGDLREMARTYFTDVPEAQAREWVIEINEGNMTTEQVEYMIRQQAASRFPELAGYISDGHTMKSYFSTHQAVMEDMLGRPVDIYREFPQLYEGGVKTQDEAKRIVRNTGEWRQSNGGQDAARLMSYQLAQVFGEVA